MHDVLDPRDLVPDEADQRASAGYAVGDLPDLARRAAADGDTVALEEVWARLEACERPSDWPYDEPPVADLEAWLARTASTRLEVDPDAYPDRLLGAWRGRCVGNTMGKPVEGLRPGEVAAYLTACGQDPQTGYLPLIDLPAGVSHLHESAPFATAGNFSCVPRDDDIDWTILGLAMLEEHGRALTTEAIAAAWLDNLPFTQTFTAERAAYRNLVAGLRPPATATHRNPYREWIGALIRADILGYTHPGRPLEAARLAVVDARLSHVANGVYGEMWAAALVASAFACTSAEDAARHALPVVPGASRLAEALRAVLELHDAGATAAEALAWAERALGHYNWVHTVNNAALISIGLLWGTDFRSAVALTIRGGCDTDSNAATVGSAYGALHGAGAIPADLIGTTHHHVRSAVRGFDRIAITDLADRTAALTARMGRWER